MEVAQPGAEVTQPRAEVAQPGAEVTQPHPENIPTLFLKSRNTVRISPSHEPTHPCISPQKIA